MSTEVFAEAAKKNLTPMDVAHRLCDEEKKSRIEGAIKRRLVAARFPEVNTVDGFEFDFDPDRKKLKARHLALHDLGFLGKGINPLFIGRPGTGKTFLARSLATVGARRPAGCSSPTRPRCSHQAGRETRDVPRGLEHQPAAVGVRHRVVSRVGVEVEWASGFARPKSVAMATKLARDRLEPLLDRRPLGS